MSDAPEPLDRPSRWGLWLTLLLVAVTAVAGSLNGLGRIDQLLYDRAVMMDGRKAAGNILIVAIDDATIDTLGRWPWRRAIHAALLDRLQGARAVGMDVIFAEPDTIHPDDDRLLAQAISRNGKVVLPVVFNQLPTPTSAIVPLPMLMNAAAGAGFINAQIDPDGVVRQATLSAVLDGKRWEHLALAMLNVGGENKLAQSFLNNSNDTKRVLIPYSGPPSHLRTISYLSVLRGELNAADLKDQYVLIGAWATGLGDTFPTPVSNDTSGMSGVEIVGNVLQAAREGIGFRMLAPWQSALLSAIPVLLLCLALWRLSPKQALLINVGMFVATLVASFLLLTTQRIWFAPSGALLGLMLCYPLWSWRSQEAALRYMDHELQRLRREYPPVLNETRDSGPTRNLSLESRVGELQHALARVRNLRRFLADGLDGMPDATLVFDQDGRLQFRNQAAVLYFQRMGIRAPRMGQLAAHLLEQTILDDTTRHVVGEALRGDRGAAPDSPWSADLEMRDRAGRDLVLKCAPIHTAEGKFAGTVATLNDISVIRQAERQREETLRFISHDMRAPQSSILALVAMAQESDENEAQSETLKRIAVLANRTLRLVDDFVHLTRAESMAINPVELDLGSLLQDAVDEFWASARKRDIALEIQHPLPFAFVRGDQTLLMRTLCNLIDNAIKYSPSSTAITCAINVGNDEWLVSIRDQGNGIAAHDVDRLFEPFTRVGRETRGEAGGAGLGLAFVRTVAERHSGKMSVTSELGKGSVFTLHLPMSVAD